MIPAVGTCLLGVFAGLLLQDQKIKDPRKVIYLLSFGVVGVALGLLWGLQFPVIKKIWTSSYVLVAGGYSAILLGAFYQIVDVWKWQRWCQPFVWMGMNSITLYMTDNILGSICQSSAAAGRGGHQGILRRTRGPRLRAINDFGNWIAAGVLARTFPVSKKSFPAVVNGFVDTLNTH